MGAAGVTSIIALPVGGQVMAEDNIKLLAFFALNETFLIFDG